LPSFRPAIPPLTLFLPFFRSPLCSSSIKFQTNANFSAYRITTSTTWHT
jgi:hypothetical protein